MVAEAFLVTYAILMTVLLVMALHRMNDDDHDDDDALPAVEVEFAVARMTPDQAMQIMPTPRQRAERLVHDYVEQFVESGDDSLVIDLEGSDKAIIAELLEYKAVGWSVEFIGSQAILKLPAVLS